VAVLLAAGFVLQSNLWFSSVLLGFMALLLVIQLVRGYALDRALKEAYSRRYQPREYFCFLFVNAAVVVALAIWLASTLRDR
jgi:hypothetical protein